MKTWIFEVNRIKDNIKWKPSYFILHYTCFLAISSGGVDMAVAVGEMSRIIKKKLENPWRDQESVKPRQHSEPYET